MTEYQEMLRRVLREELDDLWIREVSPPEGVEVLRNASIFRDPPTWSPKILFCDMDERLYVADIDEELEVEAPKTLPFTGFYPSILYDAVNENWLMLVWHPGPIGVRCYGLYRVSKDFETVIASEDPLYVEGVMWDTGGAGFLQPFADDRMYVFADGGPGTALLRGDPSALPLPTLTRRPYPVTVEAPWYATYAGAPGKAHAHDGVSCAIQVGDYWVLCLRTHHGLVFCFSVWDEEKEHYVTGIDLEGIAFSYQPGFDIPEWGFITRALGRAYILIYDCMAGPLTPRFKTYAVRLPRGWLDPRGRRLIYPLWFENAIAAGEASPAMPGWGRKTIHFTSDTAGDLRVELDAVGRNDWKEVFTLTGITSALEQTLHSGLRLRLSFSVAATVTAHVVCEP